MDENDKELLERLIAQQEAIIKNQKSMMQRIDNLERAVGLTTTRSATTAPISRVSQPAPPQQNVPPKPALPQTSQAKAKQPAMDSANLEFKIGGTWLNRLGAAAVILGLAYFLKYSFDNQWIGPTGRVILGILAGLVMLGVGEKLKTKYFVYSQGLIGAGSLAQYFSVYAAYNFYHLLTPSLAFIFLIVIMAHTVLTSVRHNAMTIGILGIIGGYAAPLLISTGQPLPWVFFGYLAILTCGILGVSVYKRWDIFRLLSFVFNQLLTGVWFFTIYRDAYLIPTLFFVLFNFIAYLVIASGYNIKVKSMINPAETVLIALNALGFFAWSKLLLEHTVVNDYMGFYALAVALVYIYIGRLANRLHSTDKNQVYILFAVAIKLITIAIFLQLDFEYVAYGWLLEAFGIFFAYSRLRNRLLLLGGLAVLALGTLGCPVWGNHDYLAVSWLGEALGLFLMGVKTDTLEIRHSGVAALGLGSAAALEMAVGWQLYNTQTFLLNWPTLTLALAIVFAGVIYFLYKGVASAKDERIRQSVGIVVLVLIFAFLSTENHHFFMLHQFNFFLSPEQLSLSLLWIIYDVVLFVTGLRKNMRGLRYAALGLVAVIILKAFFVDLAQLATVFKILLFVILGLFLLGVSFIYQKKRSLFDRSETL